MPHKEDPEKWLLAQEKRIHAKYPHRIPIKASPLILDASQKDRFTTIGRVMSTRARLLCILHYETKTKIVEAQAKLNNSKEIKEVADKLYGRLGVIAKKLAPLIGAAIDKEQVAALRNQERNSIEELAHVALRLCTSWEIGIQKPNASDMQDLWHNLPINFTKLK